MRVLGLCLLRVGMRVGRIKTKVTRVGRIDARGVTVGGSTKAEAKERRAGQGNHSPS